MATLNEVMKDTADAIREKTGKSEKIAPINFAEEIKSISAGGGESASTIEYFALTDGWSKDLGGTFGLLASLVKTETSTLGMVIMPAKYAQIANNGDDIDLIAIAIDMSLIVSVAGQQGTVKETILASGTTEESLAKYRITKEQFYDLNA